MPKSHQLLNSETGQVETIPIENLEQAILSGDYYSRDGEKFQMRDEFGDTGNVDAGNVIKAIQQGYKFRDSEDLHNEEMYKEYGDNPIEAFGEGALRTLSFGLSDWALKAAGVSEERLREIKERNKGMATTGEVAGFAPLLIGGPATIGAKTAVTGAKVAGNAGKLGQFVKAAGIGPRLAAGGGRAVEAKLAARLAKTGASKAASTSLAKKLIRETLPAAAGGMVEGAAYGTGHLISEAALGNTDLTAEHLLSSAGMGALVVGGLMGGMKVPGTVFGHYGSKAGQAMSKVKDKAGKRLAKTAEDAEQAYLKNPIASLKKEWDNAKDAYTKWREEGAVNAGIRGGQSEYSMTGDVSPYTSSQKKASLTGGMKNPETPRRYQQAVQAQKDLAKAEGKSITNKEAEALVEKSGAEHSPQLASKRIERAVEKEAETWKAKDQAIDDVLLKEKPKFKLFDIHDKMYSKLQEFKAGAEFGSELSREIKQIEKAIGKLKTKTETGTVIKVGDLKKIRDVRKSIDQAIKIKSPGGHALVELREVLNGYIRENSTAAGKLLDEFADSLTSVKYFKKKFMEPVAIDGKETLLMKESAQEKLIPTFKRLYFTPEEVQGTKLVEAIRNIDRLQKSGIEDGIKNRIMLEDMNMMAKTFDPSELGAQALTGGIAAGMGHKLRSAAQRVKIGQGLFRGARTKVTKDLLSTEPNLTKEVVEKLSSVSGVLGKSKDRLKSNIDDAFGKVKGKGSISLRGRTTGEPKRLTAPLATEFLFSSTYDVRGAKKKAKDKNEALQHRMEEISELLSSPDAMIETIEDRTAALHSYAPEVAKGVMAAEIRKFQVAKSLFPENPNQYLMGEEKPIYTDDQIQTFATQLQVIDDPILLTEHLKNFTITKDMVTAVKETSPMIYEEILSYVQEAASQRDVSFQMKLQMGYLFDTAFHGSADNQRLKGLQGNFFNEPTEGDIAGGRTGKVRAKGADKLTYGEDAATEMQRIEGGM